MPETFTRRVTHSYMSMVEIMDKGHAHIPGVDAGPLVLHYQDKETIVLKATGHTYKSGAWTRSYSPAKFWVFHVLDPKDDWKECTVFRVKLLTDFPVKTTKD